MIRSVRKDDPRLTPVGFRPGFHGKWEGPFVRYGSLLAVDGNWALVLRDGRSTPEVLHCAHVGVEDAKNNVNADVLQEVCDFLRQIVESGGKATDLDGPAGLLYCKIIQLPELQGALCKVTTHFSVDDVKALEQKLETGASVSES